MALYRTTVNAHAHAGSWIRRANAVDGSERFNALRRAPPAVRSAAHRGRDG